MSGNPFLEVPVKEFRKSDFVLPFQYRLRGLLDWWRDTEISHQVDQGQLNAFCGGAEMMWGFPPSKTD